MTSYECPWCGEGYSTEYDIRLHIEDKHTEDSPYITNDRRAVRSAASPSITQATHRAEHDKELVDLKCTRPGCGQRIVLDEIDNHIALHEPAEINHNRQRRSSTAPELNAAMLHQKAQKSSPRHTNSRTATSSSASRQTTILNFLAGRSTSSKAGQNPLITRKTNGRLGTRELGQHAFERSMPASVRRILEDAARPVAENRIDRAGTLTRYIYYPNETSGLIDLLADLCALDNSRRTYFCHASTKHIQRINCDGNFCGYWNIQMLLTYILAKTSPRRGLPTVLQIQDTIEKAWANNICSYGRVETGGIYNTRKWIGTHEAVAFFQQLEIGISASSFQVDQSTDKPAYIALLDFVEAYFMGGSASDPKSYDEDSVITQQPPIYLQRAGHSVTIVGIERQSNGNRSLLVFDSSHETSTAMSRLLDGRSVSAYPETLLQPYRWSESRLAAWKEYEVLLLVSEV